MHHAWWTMHIWIFRDQCYYQSMPLALCEVFHGCNGVTYFRLCGRFKFFGSPYV